jgi:hypothetical protein
MLAPQHVLRANILGALKQHTLENSKKNTKGLFERKGMA